METKKKHENEFLKFSDLNGFVTHVTKFYSHIFEQLKRQYPKCRLNSWVDCFITSSELEKKGDTSLRDAIASIMKQEAGITTDEWAHLQEIRRIRNAACHPNSSVCRAKEALRERWSDHPAKEAISKMLTLSEKISTPPRSSPRDIPLKNWRDRSKTYQKTFFKKRF